MRVGRNRDGVGENGVGFVGGTARVPQSALFADPVGDCGLTMPTLFEGILPVVVRREGHYSPSSRST